MGSWILGDQYKWVLASTGAWNGVGNWEDLTTSADPAMTYPGINDGATIDGPANSSSFLPITGPGNAGTFTAFGNVELTLGTFNFTSLDVGSSVTSAFLDIGPSTSVAVGTASLFSSALQVGGAGAALSIGTTLDLATEFVVENSASVQLAGLVLNQVYQSLQVDSTSIVEIGTAGGAAAGELTVDANAKLSGDGTVAAVVVDNGTIEAQGGYLRFNDAVSGPGVAEAGSGGELSFAGAVSVPISFVGTGEIEFGSILPTSTITGFGVGDQLYFGDLAFDAATYTAAGASSGYLNLTQAGATVGTIALAGATTSGATFTVLNDGFGDSAIVIAAGTAGAGSSPPSLGTTTTDSYTWNQTLGGTWGAAPNWLDGGTAASVPPGINDSVSIAGSTTTFQVISGTGNARSLSVSGDVALGGSFSVGALTLGGASGPNDLILLPSTSVTATSVNVANEGSFLITLDVAGGSLNDSGGLSDAGSVVVAAGGSLATTGVSMQTDYPLEVDASGEMVVGAAAAAMGFLTVAAGAAISGYGSIDAAIINNGTIGASGSELTTDGAITGDGTLIVGSTGMTLTGSVAATETISFAGPTGVLTVAGSTPAATIAGFTVGEVIALSTLAFNTANYASGTLTLMENGGSVGALTLAGSVPPADAFLVLPSGHTPSYNEIVLTAGTIGAGTTAAAAGTTGADHYSWTSTVGGSWNAVPNWSDTTAGSTVSAPGSNDIVTIAVSDNGFETVSGQGDAATLTTSGKLVLGGDFAAGTLMATQGGYTDALVVAQGATLLANSATLTVGTMDVDGAAALFDSPGTVSVGGYLLDAVNGGTFIAGGLTDTGYLTISVNSASAVEIGGSSDLVAGSVVVDPGATLTGSLSFDAPLIDNGVINAGTNQVTLNGSVSGTGTVQVGAGGYIYVASTIGSGVTIDFAGAGGTILIQENGNGIAFAAAPLSAPATSVQGGGASPSNGGTELVTGPVVGYTTGDMIEFENTPVTSASYVQTTGAGGTLTISNNGAAVAALGLIGNFSNTNFIVENGVFGTYVLASLACFAAGTRLAMADGRLCRVEDIAVGDSLRTADGRAAPVRWAGRSVVVPDRHPQPERVLPVRVREGAFGDGLPARDLLLSPEHAVAVTDDAGTALVPVHLLVNGASIVRVEDWRGPIAYHHVELDRHDLVLAEGQATESYLDTGNRGAFEGETVRKLHPTFATDESAASLQIWAERGCAPLLLGGERLVAAHGRLMERVGSFATLTHEPELMLVVDGAEIAPEFADPRYACFLVPPDSATFRLRSRSTVPNWFDATSGDHRRLGIALTSLVHDGAAIALDGAAWLSGVHAPEAGWRWTDGDAVLQLAPRPFATVLEVGWRAEWHRSWRFAAPQDGCDPATADASSTGCHGGSHRASTVRTLRLMCALKGARAGQ